jgi:succinoglycan biosynthesis transport protein ExoP
LLLTESDKKISDTASQAPIFDFMSVLRLLRRRKLLIAAITFLCLCGIVFVHSITPSVYTASTRILLDEQSINPFGRDEIFTDISLSNPAVESQMQVIRSPFLLSRVVNRLDLGENEVFMEKPKTPTGAWLSSLQTQFLPSLNPPPVETTEAQRFQMAVDHLRENVRVTRNAQTLVIRIAYTANSPELAAEVVNAIANTYIDNRLGARQETAERAAQWFDDRIAELNARAQEVEQRMEQISGGGDDRGNVSQISGSLQSARQALQNALAERARAETVVLRFRTLVESGRGLRGVPSSIQSDTLDGLIEEANQTREALAVAIREGGENSDEVRRLNERVASLEAAGETVLGSLLSDAEARLSEAEASVEGAQNIFDTARQASGSDASTSIDVELRSLEGEARIYRQLNERYLQSYLQVVQQQSFPSTEATIIETAVVPEDADGVGLRRLGVLGLMFGLSIGALGAFLIEAADGTVRTSNQLSKSSGSQVLGILPPLRDIEINEQSKGSRKRIPLFSAPHRSQDFSQQIIALPEHRVSLTKDAPLIYASISNPLSIFSESIRRVNVEADNFQKLMSTSSGLAPKCIGFVSDRPSTGRSLAAVNYAEMLAVGGGRTLLVDLDWTGLYLTDRMTPKAQFGLAELAVTQASITPEQAFWYDERSSLYFLPNRSIDEEAELDPGVFDQSRLKSLIRSLTDKFDNVVIDLAPMTESSDAAGINDVVLGYVAVADWGVTNAASLSKELQRAGIYRPKLLGALLNGVSQRELDKYETVA